MLKEISRSEAIERMTGDRPVYMIFELSDHEPRKEPADPDPVPGTNKQRVPDAVFRELHAKKMTNREIAKELAIQNRRFTPGSLN